MFITVYTVKDVTSMSCKQSNPSPPLSNRPKPPAPPAPPAPPPPPSPNRQPPAPLRVGLPNDKEVEIARLRRALKRILKAENKYLTYSEALKEIAKVAKKALNG
jgi:hypothetical protein